MVLTVNVAYEQIKAHRRLIQKQKKRASHLCLPALARNHQGRIRRESLKCPARNANPSRADAAYFSPPPGGGLPFPLPRR